MHEGMRNYFLFYFFIFCHYYQRVVTHNLRPSGLGIASSFVVITNIPNILYPHGDYVSIIHQLVVKSLEFSSPIHCLPEGIYQKNIQTVLRNTRLQHAVPTPIREWGLAWQSGGGGVFLNNDFGHIPFVHMSSLLNRQGNHFHSPLLKPYDASLNPIPVQHTQLIPTQP